MLLAYLPMVGFGVGLQLLTPAYSVIRMLFFFGMIGYNAVNYGIVDGLLVMAAIVIGQFIGQFVKGIANVA